MVQSGLFVALEGIDGAGTTSQLVPLRAHLRARGQTVHTTHEPSLGETGQLLRRYLRGGDVDEAALALLFAADRLQHVRTEVAPALAAGGIVLCDRYLWSSLAYQTTAEPPLAAAWVQALNVHAPAPDLTLVFTVSAATAARRRRARGHAAERFDADARQVRVAAAYAQLLAAHRRREAAAPPPGRGEATAGRVVALDAELPLEAVTAAACAAVDATLAARLASAQTP